MVRRMLFFLVCVAASLIHFPGPTEAVPALPSRPSPGRTVFAYVATKDGNIAGFRVSPGTGRIEPLPDKAAETDPGLSLGRLLLTKHPSERFLYAASAFRSDRDGHLLEGDAIPARKSTAIRAYRVEKSGKLTAIQTLTVPAAIGDLVSHPGGSLLYAPTGLPGKKPDQGNRIFLLRVLPDGRLRRESYDTTVVIGFGYADTFYQDNWGLSFSPDGSYAYSYINSYAADWSNSRYYRYRVTGDGRLREERTDWYGTGEGIPISVAADAGRIAGWSADGRTGFVRGVATDNIWVCPADGQGRLLERGASPRFLSSKAFTPPGNMYWAVALHAHPTRPLVYHGTGAGTTRFTAYKILAPGKLKQVGTFRSAFPGASRYLVAEPTGRFLYEIGYDPSSKPPVRQAVYKVGADGLPKLSLTPAPLRLEGSEQLLFVAPTAW